MIYEKRVKIINIFLMRCMYYQFWEECASSSVYTHVVVCMRHMGIRRRWNFFKIHTFWVIANTSNHTELGGARARSKISAKSVSPPESILTHTRFGDRNHVIKTYFQLHGQQDHEMCFKCRNYLPAPVGFELTTQWGKTTSTALSTLLTTDTHTHTHTHTHTKVSCIHGTN